MKHLILTITAIVMAFSSGAQTWNQDIAPIFFEHCGKCHHEGGIAPSSLLTYNDALSQPYAILGVIEEGTMPPWPANENYTHFVDENVLTEDEKTAITNWINNGFPEGDGEAPTAPSYNDGFQIASPDEIVEIPDYTVTSSEDVYRSFLIPTTSGGVTRYIGSVEFDPDNTDIVHHVLAFYDPSGVPQQSDNADPGVGWTSTGGSFPSDAAVLIGIWVPGMGHMEFPENLAIPLPSNAKFVIEVHYAPGSQDQSSAVKMRLKYKPAGNIRTVYHDPLLFHGPPSLQEPALIIPPNEISTFHEESVTTNVPLSFLSVFPHMHLLGQTFKVYALDANQDTIRFIDVDDYDFHWQFNYKFPTLLPVPTGSRLYGVATYDNTTANEENPNNPPQWVFLGENTTDEMMVCFFMYTVYQAGDENMSQVSVHEYSNDSPTRMLVYPNPVLDKLYVDYPNDIKNIQTIQLFDSNGRVVTAPFVLYNGRLEITTSGLASGVYDLVIKGEGRTLTEKVIKQ